MKYCKDCKQSLPINKFASNKKTGDGLYTYCKACAKVRKDIYRKNNPTKDREHAVKYYAKNKKKINALCKKYHHQNNVKRLQVMKKYYERNVECMILRAKNARINLSDHYVAVVLQMKKREIPVQLIEAKRVHLLLKRKLKRIANENC